MSFSAKIADKLVSIVLYVVLVAMTVWSGNKILDYAQDSRFYNDFLLYWEVNVRSYTVKSGKWPHFSGSSHVEYMDTLVQMMEETGITLPQSNTQRSYIYRIKKIGREGEGVFVLCFPRRMILYGLSHSTFSRIDRFIDGKQGKNEGSFIGRNCNNDNMCIGIWQL